MFKKHLIVLQCSLKMGYETLLLQISYLCQFRQLYCIKERLWLVTIHILVWLMTVHD